MATSSTQITFIFPFLSTYEVTLGSGSLANKLGCNEMQEKTYNGPQALNIMLGLHVQDALPLFDRSIVNLMIDRQVRYEEDIVSGMYDASGHEPHSGLMVVVHHFR